MKTEVALVKKSLARIVDASMSELLLFYSITPLLMLLP